MQLEFTSAQECDIEKIYELNKELIDTYEDIENIEYDKVLKWVSISREFLFFERFHSTLPTLPKHHYQPMYLPT